MFDRAGSILEWTDESLKAASAGTDLPDPPQLAADLFSIRVGFSTTLVHEALLIATVAVITKQYGVRRLARTFRMDGFSVEELWVPAVSVIAMYAFVIAWTLSMEQYGPEILRPQNRVPIEIQRDTVTLVMGGVLACLGAPLAEELFFRGLVFTGLLKWGKYAAMAVSAAIFSAAHFDIGSFVPFFGVGLVLAWLYWRRGCLWDSIAFHFLFNATSYALLVAGSGNG